jgi:hypothetical protein
MIGAGRVSWPRIGLILLVGVLLLGHPDRVAAQGREVHGENSTFAGPGVVVAWGILKQPIEDESEVVIRVVVTDPAYSHLAAEGVDPFSRARRPLGPGTRVGLAPPAMAELRVRRGAFADYPRLEIHLYRTGTPSPALTVYYLGVPDTTPEFVSEAPLRAYLEDAVARAQPRGRTP